MKLSELASLTSALPWFDLATLVQLSGERRGTLLVQLSRWVRSGVVIALRRGMYTLSPQYRRAQLNPAALAQALYPPSYLSSHWALGPRCSSGTGRWKWPVRRS
jgi:hypothetical protein